MFFDCLKWDLHLASFLTLFHIWQPARQPSCYHTWSRCWNSGCKQNSWGLFTSNIGLSCWGLTPVVIWKNNTWPKLLGVWLPGGTEIEWNTPQAAVGLTPIAYLSPEKQNDMMHTTEQALEVSLLVSTLLLSFIMFSGLSCIFHKKLICLIVLSLGINKLAKDQGPTLWLRGKSCT